MAIAGQGRYEEALHLAGTGSAFRSAAGVRGPVPRFWRQLQEREFGRARRELPPQIADRAREQGATASLDEAVTWVLGDTAPRDEAWLDNGKACEGLGKAPVAHFPG